MPCPLRVVLVAVSAGLLLFAASAPTECEPVEQEERKGWFSRAWRRLRDWLRLIWQLASGSIIYDYWRRGSRGHGLAMQPGSEPALRDAALRLQPAKAG
jgi:hypothetical protein